MTSLGIRRVYISGAISSRPLTARGIFANAAYRLTCRGYGVENPFDIFQPAGLCPGADWCNAMVADLSVVETVDAIYMLRGWETSPGARRELEWAREHGVAVWYE